MRTRHEKEIQKLQKNCNHKYPSSESAFELMPYYWAPGHYGGEHEICNICGDFKEEPWKKFIIEPSQCVNWKDT